MIRITLFILSVVFLAFYLKSSNDITNYASYSYPVSAEHVIKDIKNDQIFIFGYGSLINKESARRSLSDKAMATYKPAVAFGVKRLFNYDANPEFIIKRYGKPVRPNDTAALNIIETGNSSDVVNGVVFTIDSNDLGELIKREDGYDLVPIQVVLWDDYVGSRSRPKVAYAFSANLKDFTDAEINPIPGYARLSMRGAEEHGAKYYDLWLRSTYLADKRTLFVKWSENPEINCTKSGCS